MNDVVLEKSYNKRETWNNNSNKHIKNAAATKHAYIRFYIEKP